MSGKVSPEAEMENRVIQVSVINEVTYLLMKESHNTALNQTDWWQMATYTVQQKTHLDCNSNNTLNDFCMQLL